MTESPDEDYRRAAVDLLGAIAYGELSAFERLVEDAKMAPGIDDKIAIGAMATAEFGHLQKLVERLEQLGADPAAAMQAFRHSFDSFHAHTAPVGLLRGAHQGLRRRRARRGLLPRDRGLPRPRDP